MKKKTTKGFSAVSNKQFADDMGKAFKGKKKKSSNPLAALAAKGQTNGSRAGMTGAPYAFDADNTFASSDPTMARTTPQAILKKKAKMKAAKKKSATKKKVSHVLQESSMCKKCETSHKPGMHKDVKKKS